jgi:HAD superfamily hydrolase (TIGR01662 family)
MVGGIRAILFDLGSTLWRRVEDEQWHVLENEASARAGSLLPDHLRRGGVRGLTDVALGNALRQEIHQRIARAHRESPDLEPDFALICQQALWSLAITPVEYALAAEIFEALRIRSLQSRVLFEDALPTLAQLRARGYLIGIATNRSYGGAIFLSDLLRMGISPLVVPEAIAISADLGVRKPNPDLFRHALSRLQCTPTEVAMVGDNLIADVWGAQRLDMWAIWKPSPKHRTIASRDVSLKHGNSDGDLPQDELVAWAMRQAYANDSRTANMKPPDAIITDLAALLELFPSVAER